MWMMAGRRLQGCNRSHQGAFASAIGTEQPEHVVADAERDILQGFHPVWIGLGETGDGQSQGFDPPGSCSEI